MDGVAGEKLGLPWKKERGGELSAGSKNRKEGHGWLAAGGVFTQDPGEDGRRQLLLGEKPSI